MNSNKKNDFVAVFNSVKEYLEAMSFELYAYEQKGLYTHLFKYKKDNCIVEFMYGPPDYEVYMNIHIGESDLDALSLMKIKEIKEWIIKNQHIFGESDLKEEIIWYIKLLKFSLPIIKKINIHLLYEKDREAVAQDYEIYKNESIQEKVLKDADKAWVNKNYQLFIINMDKLKKIKLPNSYFLKYEIAKKKTSR